MPRKKNRQKRCLTNLHHPIPKSRGGRSTVRIHKDIHQKFHSLFGNMLPEEILDYLVEVFWGGYIPKQMRNSTFKEYKDGN